MKNKNPILLLEDDQIDIMGVKRAMKNLNIYNKLVVCANGEEGLISLNDVNQLRPALILLDINMPKMDGIEFLKIIKQDDHLKTIPVIILTSSDEQKDIKQCYSLGINGYFIKPTSTGLFTKTLEIINMYWTHSEYA